MNISELSDEELTSYVTVLWNKMTTEMESWEARYLVDLISNVESEIYRRDIQ
jgi:hypothetical protein